MRFQSDKMSLNCIQTIFQGERADVFTCVDESGAGDAMYTVIAVKDHALSKELLMIGTKEGVSESDYVIDHFAAHGMDILVFPFAVKRPLSDFYFVNSLTVEQAEDICRNVVLAAIQSKLPSPMLYLILSQNLMQLSKDRSVYISYEMNMDAFDATKTEKDCVVLCARLLVDLLEGKTTQKAITYQLLTKRSKSQGYISFAQLYKDVIIAGSPGKKKGIITRIRSWFYKHRDELFVVLLWICILVAVFALAALITQLITGDVPWLRVFFNGFKVIGTEHLNEIK